MSNNLLEKALAAWNTIAHVTHFIKHTLKGYLKVFNVDLQPQSSSGELTELQARVRFVLFVRG